MKTPAQNNTDTGLRGAAWRVLFLGVFMLLGLGTLTAKLWYEQGPNKKKWADRVKKSSVVTVRVPSVRGDICDRRGIVLAENETSYGVDFDLPEIVKGYRESHDGKVPTLPARMIIDEMPEDVLVADIVKIVNDTVVARFIELGLDRDNPGVILDYDAERRLERQFRTNEQVPFQYLYNVNFETVARLAANESGVRGVETVLRPVRRYKFGALAGHIVGYVGQPEDIDKEPDIKSFTYYQPDIVGKASVEQAYDRHLRGKPGKRVLERTPKGRVGAEIERDFVPPESGARVYLTIDARIQTLVEKTLREGGVGRGAAVVVNPNNGDILAIASVPSFDPNIYIPTLSRENENALKADESKPSFNRAVGRYLPGSTYKLVTSLAALSSGMSSSTTYVCNGGIQYGAKLMKCHNRGGHGGLDMYGGIKKSCNCYFYNLANDIGTGRGEDRKKGGLLAIERIGGALGLGVKSDLPISGESAGILPGPRWLNANGMAPMADSSGNIANTAIGQGMVLASPLQMAMVTATVANGGTSFFPRLVSRLVGPEGKDVADADGNLIVPLQPKVRAYLRDLGLSPTQVEVVRRGMWQVVNAPGGTGSRGAVKGIEVAAKTGTAQFKREDADGTIVDDNRVWFTCFAPYKEPKYAITVMIEAGTVEASGGGVAAPIVQKILKECLAIEAGIEPTVTWLDPAKGSFDPIAKIMLKEDGSLTKFVQNAFKGTDQRPGADDSDERAVDHGDERIERRENAVIAPIPAPRGTPAAVERKPNFFQRVFGPRRPVAPPTNQPGGLRR